MLKPILMLFLLHAVALGESHAGVQAPPDSPQMLVSQIASDLAIVTELSLGAPYLGQQFSVLYRLRAERPPAAVDIDPQQFSGFWSEIVSISQDSAVMARPVKGQNAVDYLLRQIIVYPLSEGKQQLPPLSIKVKRAGVRQGKPDDWDLTGASSPISIEVVALPPGPGPISSMPFVGGIQGSMRLSPDGGRDLLFEIQGTANLAFFKPIDWIKPPKGTRLAAALESTDHLNQIVEVEGHRQLSVLQRQRWRITVSGGEPAGQIEGLYLPVFEPRTRTWQSIHISGINPDSKDAKIFSEPVTRVQPAVVPSYGFSFPGRLLVIGIGVAGIIGTALILRRRKNLQSGAGMEGHIALLEKRLRTSPRAFIDAAHKVLLRVASDQGRAHNLGSAADDLDRSWSAIQKFRFSREPVAPEACAEIFELMKKAFHGRR